jgi:glycosyltransferase involved in cell wall biosynthesis
VDVIHCEHLHVARSLRSFKGARKVLDAHNVESEIIQRMADMETSPLKKRFFQWHARKTRQYEAECARMFDLILAVSSRDADMLKAMSGRDNVRVVENGVDTAYFSVQEQGQENGVVFVGSMDWRPNGDGVEYFTDKIYPAIRQKCADARFYVVGRNPSDRVLELGLRDGTITVTGTVDDVRPYVEKAKVVVVPLRFGGGTRLKVLEAFSMGKAVVSTSLGAEGIEYTHGVDILIADDPAEFASSVLGLLENEEKRAELGRNAHALACAKYGWESIGRKLGSFYEELKRQDVQ